MSLTNIAPSDGKVLSVSEFTTGIRTLLEESYPSIWVTGEISNLKPAASGHVYFTLKDNQAQLGAVIWRSTAQRLRFQLADGMEVVARGRITVYPPRGNYQLDIKELQPKGVGALELAFRQLKEKLEAKGYFAKERKKPLPRFPKCIGIVTSRSGAAVRDLIQVITRRWPAVSILVCPVRVQGDGAAEEIAAAIQLLNRLQCADVLIVGRGGGSLEDLWAFNEEIVAEAIFASRIPIISAVGHEIDFTIADFVADVRAATPSEAAELVVPDAEEFNRSLASADQRLQTLMNRRMTRLHERLADFAQRRIFQFPLERIRDLERCLDDWQQRSRRGVDLRIQRDQQRVAALAARLESLSPLNVLGRGYSLTRKEGEAALLRSAAEVQPGQRVVTRLCHGQLVSRVEETHD